MAGKYTGGGGRSMDAVRGNLVHVHRRYRGYDRLMAASRVEIDKAEFRRRAMSG